VCAAAPALLGFVYICVWVLYQKTLNYILFVWSQQFFFVYDFTLWLMWANLNFVVYRPWTRSGSCLSQTRLFSEKEMMLNSTSMYEVIDSNSFLQPGWNAFGIRICYYSAQLSLAPMLDRSN
jgi:hypothetical protein